MDYMPVAWSSKYSSNSFPSNYDEWTVEDKINLFEDQVLGWQLGIANDIINVNADENRHAGFAVLSILVSYFERIGKYIDGYTQTNRSEYYFNHGLIDVFPELDGAGWAKKILYSDVRCGMYHEAVIGGQIILTRQFNQPITIVNQTQPYIAIDPHTLTTALIEHFKNYIHKLRTANEGEPLLRNFIRRFDSKKDTKKLKLKYNSADDPLFS